MASDTKTRVLEEARAAGEEGAAVADLATAVGVSQDTVRKAAKALEAEGLVTREGPGRITAVLRRGRRRVHVIERDEKLLAAIQAYGPEGADLVQLAQDIGTQPSLAYQSMWRLRTSGQVKRIGSTRAARWVAA